MKILISNYAILDKEGFVRSFMLAKELANLGNKVFLLTCLPSDKFVFPYKREIREGIIIIAFPDIVPNFFRRTGFGILSFILKLAYVFSHKFDIYHSDVGHRPTGGLAILIKKIFFRRLIYITEWYNYYGRGGQFDNKKGIRKYTHGYYDLLFEVYDKKRADGVVCLSKFMAERAKNIGIANTKICVINGGADVRTIKFSKSSEMKKKLGISANTLTFGYIGLNERHLEEIHPFIESLNELISEHEEFSNSVLLTTGGYLLPHVKIGLTNKFELIEYGWVNYEDYSDILNSIDIFVFLQKQTLDNKARWPNRLGDYMAAGRKTIINPYGEPEDFMNRFHEPFINVSYNKESVKSELIKAVKNNSIYNDRGKIRDIAVKEVSWTSKSKQLCEFYEKILYEKGLM